MGFSEHQDNLSMKHLERQERRSVIEQKILQDTKTETTQAYEVDDDTLQNIMDTAYEANGIIANED